MHSQFRGDVRRRGVTALELSVGIALIAVMIGASLMTVSTSQKLYRRQATDGALRSEATKVLDQLAREVIPAGASTASVSQADSLGGPYFTAQQCVGVSGTNISWGTPFTIAAVKQNGSSVIQITRNGKKTIIGANLDTGALGITVNGAIVTFTLALKKKNADGFTESLTFTRTARMEN